MTEQNPPSGQAPQGEQPPQPPQAAPAPPAAPAAAAPAPEAPAPQIPHQAFGDAPAPPTPPAAPAGGEGTFGAAPGFPPPPAGEAFGAAPAPAKKKSNVVKIVSAVGAIVLATCIAGAAYLVRNGLNSDNTKQAQAGDCIGNLPDVAQGEDKAANGAKVVDCTGSDALYKVEGRLEGKTEAQAKEETVCDAFPAADSWYRAIPSGGTGYVLCLSSVK